MSLEYQDISPIEPQALETVCGGRTDKHGFEVPDVPASQLPRKWDSWLYHNVVPNRAFEAEFNKRTLAQVLAGKWGFGKTGWYRSRQDARRERGQVAAAEQLP